MAATRTDVELRRQIERCLRSDLRLDVRNLRVEVSKGTVRLTGSVPNAFQKQEALADARLLADQAKVVDELTIEPARTVPDHEVKYEVEEALVRDERLTDLRPGALKRVDKEVSVEVNGGVVLLTGMVDVPAERHMVEENVWPLPGVAGIVDRIAVAPVPERSDQDIARDVTQTLQANPWIDASSISVAVHDRTVDLTGSVPTREQKKLAGDAAWWVSGVLDVKNNLVVTG